MTNTDTNIYVTNGQTNRDTVAKGGVKRYSKCSNSYTVYIHLCLQRHWHILPRHTGLVCSRSPISTQPSLPSQGMDSMHDLFRFWVPLPMQVLQSNHDDHAEYLPFTEKENMYKEQYTKTLYTYHYFHVLSIVALNPKAYLAKLSKWITIQL